RRLQHAVAPVVAVTIGDEDVSVGSDRDIAGGVEVIGAAAGYSWRTQCHQYFSVRAELDDLLTALVTLRGPVGGYRVGDPDVAVRVDIESVRPDEHPAAKAFEHVAVLIEFVDRIGLRIPAFVAEPGLIGQRITSNNRPDASAARSDSDLANGSH